MNKIPWRYCECGCHSYTCTILDIPFRLFWDLETKWYLNQAGIQLAVFSSKEAANKTVQNLIRDRIETVKKQLKEAEDML